MKTLLSSELLRQSSMARQAFIGFLGRLAQLASSLRKAMAGSIIAPSEGWWLSLEKLCIHWLLQLLKHFCNGGGKARLPLTEEFGLRRACAGSALA